MSKYRPRPKGQQPVDVKALEERKKEYHKYHSKSENQLENIRKARFKDIIHWNSKIPSITGFNGFYGWLYWFCGDMRSGRGDWYHREAVQPMRDMMKMIPGNRFDYSYLAFSNVDSETLVFIKRSSRRSDYMDGEQWKGIIDFINEHNTKKIIKKIFFCSYEEYPVKIRDKEWKFIEDAGCTCKGDKSSYMWYKNDPEFKPLLLKGKLFKIKY